MERRTFLHMLTQAGLAGVLSSAASPALANFMQGHMAEAGTFADRPDYTDVTADYFSDEMRRNVAWIAETIIPATDTPGAIEARVHTFIELIVRDWMSETERKEFMDGLDEIERRSQETAGVSFADCAEDMRLTILEQLENEQKDHSWYFPTLTSGFESEAPFMAKLKELTVTGFFMSEIGSTIVLRPNHFPGYYEGDIPLDPEASSWSTVPRM